MTPGPRDMIDKDDYDRLERGLKPRPKPKVRMPEPEPPEVRNRINLEDIPKKKFKDLAGIRRRNVFNRGGVTFIGFDVSIDLEDGKRIDGWMDEKDLRDLMRLFKNKIDTKFTLY